MHVPGRGLLWGGILALAFFPTRSSAALTPAQTLYAQGVSLYGSGQYAQAIPFFQDTLRLGPEDRNAYLGLGASYYKLNDLPHALEAYEKALGMSPDPKVRAFVDQWKGRVPAAIPTPSPASPKPLESAEDYSPHGFYAGLLLPVSTITGSFDGTTALTSTQTGELVVLPSVGTGLGFGIKAGWRDFGGILRPVALEASYQQNLCSVSWGAAKGEADYYVVDLEARYFLMNDQRFQFCLQGGGTLSVLAVKGGSLYQQQVGDTTYDLMGINLGVGVSYFLFPGMEVGVESVYRSLSAFQVTGADRVPQNAVFDLRGDGFGFKMDADLYPFLF